MKLPLPCYCEIVFAKAPHGRPSLADGYFFAWEQTNPAYHKGLCLRHVLYAAYSDEGDMVLPVSTVPTMVRWEDIAEIRTLPESAIFAELREAA